MLGTMVERESNKKVPIPILVRGILLSVAGDVFD